MIKKKRSGRKGPLIALTILFLVLALFIGLSYKIFEGIEFDDDYTLDIEPTFGNENAPIRVYQYFDFNCPSCAAFESTVFPMIKKNYICRESLLIILNQNHE